MFQLPLGRCALLFQAGNSRLRGAQFLALGLQLDALRCQPSVCFLAQLLLGLGQRFSRKLQLALGGGALVLERGHSRLRGIQLLALRLELHPLHRQCLGLRLEPGLLLVQLA